MLGAFHRLSEGITVTPGRGVGSDPTPRFERYAEAVSFGTHPFVEIRWCRRTSWVGSIGQTLDQYRAINPMNLLRLFVPAAAWAVVVVSVVPPVNASDDDLALRQAIVDLHANAPAEVLGFDHVI